MKFLAMGAQWNYVLLGAKVDIIILTCSEFGNLLTGANMCPFFILWVPQFFQLACCVYLFCSRNSYPPFFLPFLFFHHLLPPSSAFLFKLSHLIYFFYMNPTRGITRDVGDDSEAGPLPASEIPLQLKGSTAATKNV